MYAICSFHFKSTVKITPRSLYFLTFSIVVFPMVIGLRTVVLYSKGSITTDLFAFPRVKSYTILFREFKKEYSRKYMRRKSVVRAKNTRNKHVFAQVKPICYARWHVLTTTLYYVHSYISELVRDLHVFDNNVAVPDVLETVFFQFKLVPVCGKCLIHPLFVLYLFCSTPATVVYIVNSQ